jgi:hypothetical protein
LRWNVSTTSPCWFTPVVCTCTTPRLGLLLEGFTLSTRVSASSVSPTHTGTPKRMSMYSRLARAFSDTSSTLWLNTTSITSPGFTTSPGYP